MLKIVECDVEEMNGFRDISYTNLRICTSVIKGILHNFRRGAKILTFGKDVILTKMNQKSTFSPYFHFCMLTGLQKVCI